MKSSIRIPADHEFSSDYLDMDDIKAFGERVLEERFPDLAGEVIIDYRWKQKGGSSGGRSVLGKCVKYSGLARHLALGAHFCVWLGADNCRDAGLNEKQLEALMFHELCHVEMVEPEDAGDLVTFRTRGHDVEVFYAELAAFGAWKSDLATLEQVVRQLPLPMDPPKA